MVTYAAMFTPYFVFRELSDFVWIHTGFYMVRILYGDDHSNNRLATLSGIASLPIWEIIDPPLVYQSLNK